jgi:hypothetical protein
MSTDNDFPLIYCNGDSYSDQTHHLSLMNNTYVDFVAKACNGFAINAAINGSCNRRIIRTTLHDMLLHRQQNPTQPIIALLGLSFELRSELWIDQNYIPQQPQESNFVSHQFSSQINWRQNLLNNKDIQPANQYNLEDKFFKQYSQGRAYFFSPYAERINLLTDLIMLKAVLDSIGVQFLIFQSPTAESLETEYLVDFFKKQLSTDPRFFDLETFGFCDWAHSQGFIPLDYLHRPNIGHYGADAHEAFAKQILIPKLKELCIL